MNYSDLTHEEKIHTEEVYSNVADLLVLRKTSMGLNSNNIAKIENGDLIVCNVLASMIKYDSILQKLNIKVIPYHISGLYKVYSDNKDNMRHFISDIMRYI